MRVLRCKGPLHRPIQYLLRYQKDRHAFRMQSMPAHRNQSTGKRSTSSASSSSTTSSPPSESTAASNSNFSVTIAGAAALFFGGGLTARYVLYREILPDASDSHTLRKDASQATVLLQSIPSDQKDVLLTQSQLDQNHEYREVDAAQFEHFVAEQRQLIQKARRLAQQNASTALHNNLELSADDATQRINAFCDWYLSYATTYKLLGIALKSAAEHAITFRKQETLAQKVSADLEKHVMVKYEAMVLRPALTNPQIHKALTITIQEAHTQYLESLQELESSVAEFLVEHSKSYRHAPTPKDVILELDWATQLQKVQHIPTAYDKSPERSVALVTASAVAGKLAGASASVTATKALAAKMVAPFASKAAASVLSGKAVAGAASGAVLGGPIGALAGTAVGIGVDVSVNAISGMMQRSALQTDVQASVQSTLNEWEDTVLRPEVQRVLNVWYDHAGSLLMKHSNQEEEP